MLLKIVQFIGKCYDKMNIQQRDKIRINISFSEILKSMILLKLLDGRKMVKQFTITMMKLL